MYDITKAIQVGDAQALSIVLPLIPERVLMSI